MIDEHFNMHASKIVSISGVFGLSNDANTFTITLFHTTLSFRIRLCPPRNMATVGKDLGCYVFCKLDKQGYPRECSVFVHTCVHLQSSTVLDLLALEHAHYRENRFLAAHLVVWLHKKDGI